MRTLSPAVVTCIALACGYAMSPTADAATSLAWSINTGSACQLSIPTTNTGVRPKAPGFRNESTTVSNFVICPVSSSVTPNGGATFDRLSVFLQSIDGVTRDVTCTVVVDGDNFIGLGPKYSSKTVSIGSSVTVITWDNLDFVQPAGTPITGSALASITCNLPPQMLIQHTEGRFNYEIGT